MCGRYFVAGEGRLAEIIERMNARGAELKTGEICPGDRACVFVGVNKVLPLSWGFEAYDKKKLIINARSETVALSKMFSPLIEGYRALVPANAYFEWDKNKSRHSFAYETGFYMAGLFRPREASFVILTREAQGSLYDVHPRMPVIFNRIEAENWLNPQNDPLRIIKLAQTEAVKEIDL